MKLNLNIDKDFKLYTLKQILFIFSISLFFFVLFFYNFGLILASFLLWAFLTFGVLILYLDIKFMWKIQKLEEEINNLKNIIKLLKLK